MKKITCIICPNGCTMSIEPDGNITGNRCRRGLEFAKQELTCPMRSVCTVMRTVFEDCPVVPVKTSGEVPRDKVAEVVKEIKRNVLTQRKGRSDTVIHNVCNTGCDVVVTSSRMLENKRSYNG